jgi:predicted transcriptional regulator
MLAHLNYNMPSNNEIISVDTNIGVIKVSSVNNMLNRVFKYNLRGGGNISIREGFQIPNTRTAIQHTGFLKLFSDINYNSISDIEKQLRDIYHMSPDKHSIPLYCALIKASVIIKYIIPMCLEECMK